MMSLNYMDINASECGTEGSCVIFLSQFSIRDLNAKSSMEVSYGLVGPL